jgi:8-oxo-dGTP diphosphatase
MTDAALTDDDLAARYPVLFEVRRWTFAQITPRFTTVAPPEDLVSNVHVVAFVGDRIVLCRDDRDVWFLPGGTREPDESVHDCAVRELAEEAGARLVGDLHWFGAHRGVSDAAEPHRPHLPHPEKAWLWCYAEVEIVGAPGNPDDGEHVLEARALDLDDALRLSATDWEWSPELLSLAVQLRAAG